MGDWGSNMPNEAVVVNSFPWYQVMSDSEEQSLSSLPTFQRLKALAYRR